MTRSRPRALIEDWLPVAELGAESRRERTISVAIPPLSRIHVWWARRPLAASAGVVLAGLLPAWSPDVKAVVDATLAAMSEEARRAILHPRPSLDHARRFGDATEEWYREWYLHLLGIWGDPVWARTLYDAAVASGVRIPNPYNYKQAYKNNVERHHIDLLRTIVKSAWGGDELPVVLDSTAGGGSIPFVATRYGFPTIANDLNAVAASVLDVGVRIPAAFGAELASDMRRWGETYVGRIADKMRPFFPSLDGEKVEFYLYANAVACPRTGRTIPLSPDWWLQKKQGKVAVRLVTERAGVALDDPEFEVVSGRDIDFEPSEGTVARGSAISPYDHLVVDAEYIKAEAQADRMWPVLYAVVVRRPNGKRDFRAPTPLDLAALDSAAKQMAACRDDWFARGHIPTEDFPEGNDQRPLYYGMSRWADFFSDRQLLVHGTASEEFHRIVPEVISDLGEARGRAVLTALALLQGKALNYNSKLASWHVNQQAMRPVFDRHDFAFKWTFAEYEGSDGLYPWAMHVVDNYEANAALLDATGRDLTTGAILERNVTVTCASAADLDGIDSGSVAHLCMDPPYYDNVMYAELADYFYVWERRTLAQLVPYFADVLSDKANEAVANPARFAAMGRRRKELADLDYEAKMTAIFAEAGRVLRDDGLLSVMFTHKRADAWDTLGMGLLKAGFTIETSWPVNTEAEASLHQANMNSAASTVMLVCRKRDEKTDGAHIYLEDIEQDIRQAARDAVRRFQHDGIEGVDLLLSTYGPTLSVISRNWPVYSSTPDADGRDQLLRPEDALDLAREEVVELRRARLVGRAARIDDVTDFVLMAWDIFRAREFPFDTARLLALAVGGLDVDDLARWKVVATSAGTARLLPPAERLRRSADHELPGVRPDAERFDYLIDAVDTAIYIAEFDESWPAVKRFLDRHGYTNSAPFIATLQGLVNAVPRTKVRGSWVVPEAGLLDTLCTLYFPDVTLPDADDLSSLVTERPATLFDDVE